MNFYKNIFRMPQINLLLSVVLFVSTVPHYGTCFCRLYYGNSGAISVNNYGRSLSCDQRILLYNKRKWIKLTWHYFKVDGDMPYCKDYVQIFTGCGYLEHPVAKFCSNNLVSSTPHDIYSPTGCMRIRLVSSGSTSKSNLGFSASYFSGTGALDKTNTFCSSRKLTTRAGSGVIQSPYWPSDYSYDSVGNPLYRECDWKIYATNSQKNIQLNIMDFDVSYSRICTRSSSYLEIKDRRTYCGKKLPFVYNTKSNDVDIKFKVPIWQYGRSPHRGFVIGWVVYSTPPKSKKRTQLIGGIIAAAVIVVVIIGIIVGLKYRRARSVQAANRATRTTTMTRRTTNQAAVNQPMTTVNQPATQQPYPLHPPYTVRNTPCIGAPPPYTHQGYLPPNEGSSHPPPSLVPQGTGHYPPPPTVVADCPTLFQNAAYPPTDQPPAYELPQAANYHPAQLQGPTCPPQP